MKKLLTIILLTFTILVNAQSTKKTLKQANKLYKQEHYLHALPLYEKVVENEPNNAEGVFKEGVCLLNTFKKKEALDLILKAQGMDANVNEHLEFWLGLAYHSNMDFEESNKHLKTYEETLKKKDSRREDCENHIAHNQHALDYVDHPVDFMVRNLGEGINSFHADHSPVVSKDGKTLIYTSRRESSTGHKEAPDGDYFEDILQSELGEDGKTWGEPHSISKHLNSVGHDASIQLYDNDTKLLMYKNTKQGDFYYSDLVDGLWQDPIELKGINTNSYESDAHMSQDGNTIYFASDRESRGDNLDLFVSTKDAQGIWSEPTPIAELNTEFDEDSPFLTADGNTLYFSSRGRNTMGGYDIFKSEKQGDKWGTPLNMGYPVNSPDDDLYFFMLDDNKTAFMSSFRLNGLGDKDIYMIKPIPNIIVKGEVIDTTGANKGKPISDVTVTFTNLRDTTLAAADSTYSPVTSTDSLNPEPTMPEETGFDVSLMSARDYLIHVIKDGDTLFTEVMKIDLYEDEGIVLEKNFYLAYTDSSEMKLVTKDSSDAKGGFEIKDIYFDFDKSNLTNKAIPELDNIAQIMDAYPDTDLKIRIIGHTDSKGAASYNMKLSKRRAMRALNYLAKKGIDRERLILEYKGETEPIVPNTLPDGSDNPEGRAKNRRTEFRFLDSTK